MSDGTGLAEALLGLDGFRVLQVAESADQVVVTVETMTNVVGCTRCGCRAEAQDCTVVDVRDLACFGRPARLRWIKRRWRCVEADCDAKTWTETSAQVSARVLLTRRAGMEACRQVGENARAVSELAEELGVCWWTVMGAVVEHGTPLVADPDRVGAVSQLGVDETSYLRATAVHPTLYATGLVDLDARILIDLVEGNSASDLRRMVRGTGPGMAGSDHHGGHRPGRELPRRPLTSPGPRHPGGRSVSRGPGGQPLRGQGAATGPERDARRGSARAAVAVGHSILVIAWHLLSTGEPYNDLGGDYFDRSRTSAAHLRRLVAQLEAMGHKVTLERAA